MLRRFAFRRASRAARAQSNALTRGGAANRAKRCGEALFYRTFRNREVRRAKRRQARHGDDSPSSGGRGGRINGGFRVSKENIARAPSNRIFLRRRIHKFVANDATR